MRQPTSLILAISTVVVGACTAASAGGGSHGGPYIAESGVHTVYQALNHPATKPARIKRIHRAVKGSVLQPLPDQNPVSR